MKPDRALELAVDAAAFIEGQRRDHVWARTPEADSPIDHTLYHGTAGIVLFLLELATATGDTAYEAQAVAAGRTLLDVVTRKSWASVAFATGWPGYAFVFDQLHHRTGDSAFAAATDYCVDRLMLQSAPLGSGIGWIEPMPFSDITGFTGEREIYDLSVGAAGAALALLTLATNSGRETCLGYAAAVGERLLEVAEHTEDGAKWALMSDMPFPFTAPNFAHGGAGVGYLMARLFQATGDARFRTAAIDAARYVTSRMSAVGDGALVCHTEEQQPPEFYLGQCHGPAGTGRLFALLATITGDPTHLAPVAAMVRGINALGAPQERSWGWWANHGRCCGDAGLGDAALLLSEAVGRHIDASGERAGSSAGLMELASTRSALDDIAHRCAHVIEARSSTDHGGRSWLQAEHRARPRFLQAQTGFMQGAAGIGSFLVHLAAQPSGARDARIAFPDDFV
jgi:hypothetical protein